MRVVVWATLIVALSSTVSFAEPPLFLPGRYVLPVMAHDLYVSPPGQPGTTVTVNFQFKPIRVCTDTLDSVLVYQLPPELQQCADQRGKRNLQQDHSVRRNGIQVHWREATLSHDVSTGAVAEHQGEW